uniref:Integrase catalytic domain-containing protein n=1 Tax=Haemonchus placei TaxID=6290 RepID=A0A0N4W7H6_HAEPC
MWAIYQSWICKRINCIRQQQRQFSRLCHARSRQQWTGRPSLVDMTRFSQMSLGRMAVRHKERLGNSNLGYETTNSVLLLPNHIMTRIIIRDTHEKIGHQGVNATLSEIQRYFWIPQGRQTTKKKAQGLPYKYPEPPPLPEGRVRISRPFEHVGIDYAGPFTVKVSGTLHEKRWICLITCMSTRAIHLEIIQGLTVIEFIRALRRFMSRRGPPKTVSSDNATTFESGSAIVKTLFETSKPIDDMNNFLVNRGIQWNFITPLSPWKGGFYERLIGSVKSCLRKTMRGKFVSDDEFLTVKTECEAIVNSRPLTYVSSDIKDSLPIRPVDFLRPHANITPWIYEPDYDPEYKLIGTNRDVEKL